MNIFLFYIASTVALVSTLMVITRLNAIHALLYLIVSLLSVATIFFVLGAEFAAALQVIVYAGAVMVLMVFVIMMLNQGDISVEQESEWFSGKMWRAPSVLIAVLLAELLYVVLHPSNIYQGLQTTSLTSKDVAVSMFGPYVLIVELASLLLLAGLVGAFHLSKLRDEQKSGSKTRHHSDTNTEDQNAPSNSRSIYFDLSEER